MLDVNGNAIGDGTLELLTFTETGSAIDHINITNAIASTTTTGPILGVAGDGTNINLILAAKGAGQIQPQNQMLAQFGCCNFEWDGWHNAGLTQSIKMEAGKWVSIEVRFDNRWWSHDHLAIQWSSPSQPWANIPGKNFCHPGL